MEKRIGTVTILISDRSKSAEINTIISEYSDLVLCRQGLPFHDRPVAVISLIVEGQPDRINALTGKLGRLEGVETKAILTKNNY
jgi:putative iron-only hydrogenase system regulator